MTSSPKQLLQQMFNEMVVRKNADLIAHFYHPEFVLESNGYRHDFATFEAGHRALYSSDIQYSIRYDDASWVEGSSQVAVRMWIATRRSAKPAIEFEVVLIAVYEGRQIRRLVELTWPDWTRADTVKEYTPQLRAK